MINCNPETVSTDFDTADKLYFEPVFWEHIYDIIRHENPYGVIVQLGGQNCLKTFRKARSLRNKYYWHQFPVARFGRRSRKFFYPSKRKNNIPYPEFGVAETADQALELATLLDFPILVRPSYVLGGQKEDCH